MREIRLESSESWLDLVPQEQDVLVRHMTTHFSKDFEKGAKPHLKRAVFMSQLKKRGFVDSSQNLLTQNL